MTTTSPPPSAAEKGRLLRRAQLVARLRHPNLVRMLPLPGGAGLAPVLNEARRLADFTLPAGTFKRFDLEQVVRLLLDVLSGLAALHEVEHEGVPFVHGEASPQNIYVDEHGTARLVPLLSSHLMVGARPEHNGYVAPERLLGDAVDCRADVFSVGAMLWEALSGQRLFPDSTPDAVLTRLVGAKVPPIELSARLSWAKPLCRIAERAIAVDPKARFASAVELSNAIAAAAGPQLSKVDTDAWQDEAPTPVFQPGLHLATFRGTTLQPQVLDLPPVVESAPAPAALPPRPVLEDPTLIMGAKEDPTLVRAPPLERDPSEVWPRGRRGRGAALAALVLVLLAVGLTGTRAPGVLRQLQQSAGSAASWLGSPAPPLAEPPPHSAAPAAAPTLEARAPTASAAPPVAPSASTEPVESTPPSAAAASTRHQKASRRAAPSRSPVAAPSSHGAPAVLGAPAAAPRHKAKAGDGSADYGI